MRHPLRWSLILKALQSLMRGTTASWIVLFKTRLLLPFTLSDLIVHVGVFLYLGPTWHNVKDLPFLIQHRSSLISLNNGNIENKLFNESSSCSGLYIAARGYDSCTCCRYACPPSIIAPAASFLFLLASRCILQIDRPFSMPYWDWYLVHRQRDRGGIR